MSILFIGFSIGGFSQSKRFRLTKEMQNEIRNDGTIKNISHVLWLDRQNTLELQQKNMVLSINNSVFIFNILKREIIDGNMVKYSVYIPSSKTYSEVWQVVENKNTMYFEIYKNNSFFVKYTAFPLQD